MAGLLDLKEMASKKFLKEFCLAQSCNEKLILHLLCVSEVSNNCLRLRFCRTSNASGKMKKFFSRLKNLEDRNVL